MELSRLFSFLKTGMFWLISDETAYLKGGGIMAKTLFTIETNSKMALVEYMQMIKMKRSEKVFKSKRDYKRKEKHRKDWMEY